MEDTSLFRTAQKTTIEEKVAEPVKKPTETITISEIKEQPPSISEPYITKLLEIEEAKDHFEMPKLLGEINEFVLSEMKRNHLKDTNEAYKGVIDQYLSHLKLPQEIDIYTKVEQLNEIMMIDKKLIEAMLEKEAMFKKPIGELTSTQLLKRINDAGNH